MASKLPSEHIARFYAVCIRRQQATAVDRYEPIGQALLVWIPGIDIQVLGFGVIEFRTTFGDQTLTAVSLWEAAVA
jgi:hypothetical protein